MPAPLDLRPLCESGTRTRIQLSGELGGGVHSWIELGEVFITRKDGVTKLSAPMADAYDEEHDRCYALRLNLIGFEWLFTAGTMTRYRGYIHPADDLNVPPDETDTREGTCKDCPGKRAHQFAPYSPPHNAALFEKIRGRLVRIEVISGA